MEKCCSKCGRVGRLEAVCWEGKGAHPDTNTLDPKKNAGNVTATSPVLNEVTKPPWMCHKCHTVVTD